MAIRQGSGTVGQGGFQFTTTDVGTSSVAGGLGFPFLVPQDTDNITVKFTASVIAGGMSAVLQTSDDGGTTYYDVARTSIVSNGVAQWISATPISTGVRTGVTQSASVISAGIGSASASTLGSQQVSGLPILGVQNRVFFIYTGGITVSSVVATVRVNQQSATA